MLLKKAVYKNTRVIRKIMIRDEVHGCDCCRKEIKEYPNESSRLILTVWPKKNQSNTETYHFCTWKCLLKFIPRIKSNYFASLPHLHFDSKAKERTAIELKNIIKTLKL